MLSGTPASVVVPVISDEIILVTIQKPPEKFLLSCLQANLSMVKTLLSVLGAERRDRYSAGRLVKIMELIRPPAFSDEILHDFWQRSYKGEASPDEGEFITAKVHK